MFKFDNQYKLYNLAEALSLDNFDSDDTPIAQSIDKVKTIEPFDRFLYERILNDSVEPLDELDEIVIQSVNSDTAGKFDKKLVVADRA